MLGHRQSLLKPCPVRAFGEKYMTVSCSSSRPHSGIGQKDGRREMALKALNLGTMLTGMRAGTPPEMQTPRAAAGKAGGGGWGVRGVGRSSQSGSNSITAQGPTGLSLPGEGFLPPLEGTPEPPHCALSLLDPHLPGNRTQSFFCRLAALRTPTRKPPGE